MSRMKISPAIPVPGLSAENIRTARDACAVTGGASCPQAHADHRMVLKLNRMLLEQEQEKRRRGE